MSAPDSRGNAADIKYARGVGARIPSNQRPLRALEWAVLVHVAVLVVITTWLFGGGHEALRPYIAWWGSLSVLLTLTALQEKDSWRDGWLRPIWWLSPLVVFNLLVMVAILTPNLREVKFGSDVMLLRIDGLSQWIPSTAKPGPALRHLWFFDALWLSCFNLVLVIRQRRAIRGLLLVVAANALVLAIFGTVQKLAGSEGLFFNAVKSPQKYFFSTFIYHNHWGAFTLLCLAMSLGLVWHYARRRQSRDIYHSPVVAGLVAILLLAASIPLSASRSSTMLATGLFGGTFIHWCARLVQKRRQFKESIAPPLIGAILIICLAVAGVWYVARDTIQTRFELTKTQVTTMRSIGGIGDRSTLYHDTWLMAKDRPIFGWGMGSYPDVFQFYNSQYARDMKATRFYRDAHSDWIQSVAEHGFVGTTLIGLCAILPLIRLRRRHIAAVLPVYLLAGCAIILLYAWVEFPFANLAVVLMWWLCFFCAVQYARLYDREAPTPVKNVPASD